MLRADLGKGDVPWLLEGAMGEGARRGFVGRAGELAALRDAFAVARAGRSMIVVVEGEAGIGKTALVRRFLQDTPELQVAWASGDAAETGLEFGIAAQWLDTLPGRAGATSGSGSLAVGAALLAWVSTFEQRGPTAVVLDDAQWMDAASARAVLFLLRRLRADPVLVLVAARPHGLDHFGEGWARLLTDPGRARRIRLPGLTATQVRELAATDGCALTAEAAARLGEHTGGNPLYVSALLAEFATRGVARRGRPGCPRRVPMRPRCWPSWPGCPSRPARWSARRRYSACVAR